MALQRTLKWTGRQPSSVGSGLTLQDTQPPPLALVKLTFGVFLPSCQQGITTVGLLGHKGSQQAVCPWLQPVGRRQMWAAGPGVACSVCVGG